MNNKKQLLMGCAAAVCLLIGQITESLAQRSYNTHFVPYSSVTFGGGTSTYLGDLAGYSKPFKTLFTLPRWNVGLGYTRQFTPRFAARAMFTWARITGDDYTYNKNDIQDNITQYVRNLHFRNDVKEFAITGIYNFREDGRNPENRAKITPYVFGGLALVAHSPEALTPDSAGATQRWVKLQPLHTEGQGQPGREKPYSLVTIAIPVGIGVRYRLNESFNIGAEIGYRYVFTDYLDDVGPGIYATRDTQQGIASSVTDRRREVLAAREKDHPNRYDAVQNLINSGNVEVQDALNAGVRGAKGIFSDGYLLTNFSIQYIIPTKIKCPPIK
ncbi:DUF6089 family protein [Spirosoma validum]|uniref:Outer membrane beta-barrel protein n=1 Tax=Spirosoma validum TaxID=2771355 RepID=A0A927B102_9BACT|nr:DUF6089 family protein [Spirosoma validum]MBD2753576.1 outer membrane beta-barrel protein [Spirosoma validum]